MQATAVHPVASAVADTVDRIMHSDRTMHLDADQRAVLALEPASHRAVIGAAGTGKTTALIEFVADLVQRRGVPPERIRVLAPERGGATSLRDRLAARIRVVADGPFARSVASFAFGLVQAAAIEAGEAPVRLLTGAQQDELLAELLAGHVQDGRGPAWPDALGEVVRMQPGFRTEFRDLIDRAVALGLTPRGLEAAGVRAARPEWVAAAAVWSELERVTADVLPGALDAAELVADAAGLIRSGRAVAPDLVIVDDAQDLGPGVARLLRALADAGAGIVLFGNPDQAAGSFRGGDPGVLTALGQVLARPVPPPLALTTAYRRATVAVLEPVVSRIGTAGAVAQRAAYRRATPGPSTASGVAVVRAATGAAEATVIAQALRQRHLRDGVEWSRMAVLVRSRAMIPHLERVLAESGVPVHGLRGGRALRDEHAAGDLARIVALGVAALPPSAPLLEALLLGPFGGLDPLGLRRLRLALRHRELADEGTRSADVLLLEAFEHPELLAAVPARAARRLERLAAMVAEVREATTDTIEELLWRVWAASGLAKRWQTEATGGGEPAVEANRQLDGVVALFAAARRSVERGPAVAPADFLTSLLSAPVPEDSLAPSAATQAVVVTTPSAVVGAEFDTVAVAGLQQGVWPNPRQRGSLLGADALGVAMGERAPQVDRRRALLDDELRLFVLAASRACERLLVTAVDDDEVRPSSLFRLVELEVGADPDAPPRTAAAARPMALRPLVGELRRRLVECGDGGAASALAALANAGVPGADPDDWYGLRDLSTERPLVELADPDAVLRVSPSGVDTFERSPMHWFVDRVAFRRSQLSAAIGTAVHQAMQTVSEGPGEPTAHALWREIEQHWSHLPFEAEWLERRERRRLDEKVHGLSAYLTEFANGGGELIATEQQFLLRVGRTEVVGTIDRVERTADGALVVVDLKTSRTKPDRLAVPAHPQLQAYQLAIAADEQHADATIGGARLLYLAVSGTPYTVFEQAPLDAGSAQAARERLDAAAHGMNGPVFDGETELGERDPLNAYSYRVQLVPAVSA